ncbi:sporulation protein YabP [Syntrophobotulus glycolicus DSM 8271]|uniref:Sporulation protein YabP n=1 Tax=Syntrophobotulus glycolicus (strain DSM 8271 / FlGlyR) TaxID=645991 RepID=F0SW90_SYNGF|nr:sporulation protein YabP [Syntrophobotulus glycolicus]ADY54576.1 sporulation protein YabP [Syntrophobotulus glycolicus DSM 8271]
MVKKTDALEHKITMENRSQINLSGVNKVKSFEAKEIVLDTIQGVLAIKGHELGIKNLNLEDTQVEIEGMIDSLHYSANKSGTTSRSILEKMFK